ncbi:apocytochrome f [Anthocerotibacter panamensis]|uniref:apocytochrome f n=1 Tax=Anthocerotibacter panamensis TaxID=2857077 RepID=UPI001C403CD0|nr:apocytochrome f [Anthocerotibacter panamensis]
MKKTLLALAGTLWLTNALAVHAFPQYAAKYPQPRESSGRIACANCHLKEAEVEVELPQAVAPGQVFEVEVHIPYDVKAQEVVSFPNEQGEYKATLQAGAFVQLPKGFRVANPTEHEEDKKLLTEEQLKKLESGEWPQAAPLDTLADPPREQVRENIVVVGPIDTETMTKLGNTVVIPVIAPDPNKDKNLNFGKYSVYVGGNRGRGQVYPDGSPSNNAQYIAPAAGEITKITSNVPVTIGEVSYESGGALVTLKTDKGEVEIKIPPGPNLTAKVGDKVTAGQALTTDPNVVGGGFGHLEKDLVLQDPQRVVWLLVTLAVAFLCQVLLVLKKKQVEKIQAYEAQQQGLH